MIRSSMRAEICYLLLSCMYCISIQDFFNQVFLFECPTPFLTKCWICLVSKDSTNFNHCQVQIVDLEMFLSSRIRKIYIYIFHLEQRQENRWHSKSCSSSTVPFFVLICYSLIRSAHQPFLIALYLFRDFAIAFHPA